MKTKTNWLQKRNNVVSSILGTAVDNLYALTVVACIASIMSAVAIANSVEDSEGWQFGLMAVGIVSLYSIVTRFDK